MKTFEPANGSWYENHFNYKVVSRTTWNKGTLDDFFRIKEWLQDDEARWGRYREHWFAHVYTNIDSGTSESCFYFMDPDTAMLFRLSAQL